MRRKGYSWPLSPSVELGKPFLSLGPLFYNALSSVGLLGMYVHAETPASSRAGPGRSLQGHGNVQHLLPFAAQRCTPLTEQEMPQWLQAGSLPSCCDSCPEDGHVCSTESMPAGKGCLKLKPDSWYSEGIWPLWNCSPQTQEVRNGGVGSA